MKVRRRINRMTVKNANKIYDLLVSIGGAYEGMRDDFVYAHLDKEYHCEEWRFGGKLGFGGKYRSYYNTVDCYSEDETPKRLELIEKLNAALAELKINNKD